MPLLLQLQLGGTSFLCGVAAGWIMHRADFCLAGSLRDYFLFGHTLRLRALCLTVAASMVGLELLRLSGLLALHPFPGFTPISPGNLVGGLLFGLGMVLAGGCVVGTLYRLGSGRLSALLTLCGLLAGSALYAELFPGWRSVASRLALPLPPTVPATLTLPPTLLVLPLAFLAALRLRRWFRRGQLSVPSVVAGYLQPWRAALLLSLVTLASALLTGLPLGVTTSYAKVGALLEARFWPEHVASLAYFQLESLNYLPPLAETAVRGGPGPRWDGIAAIQLPLVGGIVLGAALSALRLGEWRLHLGLPGRQAVSALLGGLIMGLAARLAPGCNVWHLLGGLPILAWQSLLFVAGLIPGAWLGSRLLQRWVFPPGCS